VTLCELLNVLFALGCGIAGYIAGERQFGLFGGILAAVSSAVTGFFIWYRSKVFIKDRGWRKMKTPSPLSELWNYA
jgi:hypothetical protein